MTIWDRPHTLEQRLEKTRTVRLLAGAAGRRDPVSVCRVSGERQRADSRNAAAPDGAQRRSPISVHFPQMSQIRWRFGNNIDRQFSPTLKLMISNLDMPAFKWPGEQADGCRPTPLHLIRPPLAGTAPLVDERVVAICDKPNEARNEHQKLIGKRGGCMKIACDACSPPPHISGKVNDSVVGNN